MQWQQLGYGCETSPSQNLFYVVHRNYQANWLYQRCDHDFNCCMEVGVGIQVMAT